MLPSTRGLSRAAAVAATLVVALSGCGDDGPEPSSHHSASPSPTAASRSTPTTPSAGPSKRPGGALLTSAEVPRLATGEQWLAVSTTHREPASFGTCQRFGILAIGAERVVVRRFRPADIGESPNLAAELVATFPDAMTARRAYSVLTAWRDRCSDLLRRFDHPQVGALQSVPVTGGQGDWYLLTYGPVRGRPGKVFLDAQGMVLVGNRIAMLSLIRVGDKSSTPPPMAGALAAAAARLR
jgi:hypothetical protein